MDRARVDFKLKVMKNVTSDELDYYKNCHNLLHFLFYYLNPESRLSAGSKMMITDTNSTKPENNDVVYERSDVSFPLYYCISFLDFLVPYQMELIRPALFFGLLIRNRSYTGFLPFRVTDHSSLSISSQNISIYFFRLKWRCWSCFSPKN